MRCRRHRHGLGSMFSTFRSCLRLCRNLVRSSSSNSTTSVLIPFSASEASKSDDEDRPSFSLVTGKYRQAKRYDDSTCLLDFSDPRINTILQTRLPQSPNSRKVAALSQHASRKTHWQSWAIALLVCRFTSVLVLYTDNHPLSIAHFLQSREYRGLDPRLGLDEPSVLEQGRSGIASVYRDVDHKS